MTRSPLARITEIEARAEKATKGDRVTSLREHLTYGSHVGSPHPDALRAVYADECIRQMEWASHITVLSELPGLLTAESIGIAPEDWKP